MNRHSRALLVRGGRACYVGRKYAITFRTVGMLLSLTNLGWHGAIRKGSLGPFGLWVRTR